MKIEVFGVRTVNNGGLKVDFDIKGQKQFNSGLLHILEDFSSGDECDGLFLDGIGIGYELEEILITKELCEVVYKKAMEFIKNREPKTVYNDGEKWYENKHN